MSEITVFARGSQAEVRRLLLGDFSSRSEKPDDELQRAYERAHQIVGERGRGVEDESLLLARAVVRLSSHVVEFAEQRREAQERADAADAAEDARRVSHATEVAEVTLQLAGARERIRAMMRQQTRVASERERTIELMLAMLANSKHRVSDHPEWVKELGELSGAVE